MSRNSGKQKKNFACQMDATVFSRLSQYCNIAHQSKTSVVEQALTKYLEDNFERMQKFQNELNGVQELSHEIE